MNPIIRKSCVMCQGELHEIYRFDKFPIYMGVSDDSSVDVYSDKVFASCQSCGCVQLKELVPLDILYNKNHNSAIGGVWNRHHQEFVDFISGYVSGSILEIGGGNLKVANALAHKDHVKKITVFDKSFPFEKQSDKIVLEPSLFEAKQVNDRYDVVIHTHLIEHLYNPIEEMRELTSVLPVGGYMMFAAPAIDKMLADNYTNAMNFEHTYLLCERKVNHILNCCGLHVVDKKYFSKHAVFYIAQKKGPPTAQVSKCSYQADVDIFMNFFHYHASEVKKIKGQMNMPKQNTFIFGAHIFTQYLLAFGLQEDMFLNVLDNDPDKQGHTLYGTELVVKSPKILKNMENPLVVLKAAMYTDEIKSDILQNINSNTRFIL